ncbi:MAG: hypothetical protein EPN93_13165 [Spirochaetes bacterium]|nr:MAG: hypothetical protein EPN93_13165 [Spirochaetota bacterium]
MPLTDREVQTLIAKLRGKYAGYAKKYSKSWFNADAFEDRLLVAIKNRMNLEAFIFAEIANFEKTREKYEKKKNAKSFTRLVDRIMEDNMARVKKYTPVYFHPQAELEIVHCYGAISEFALYHFPVFWLISNDIAKARIIEIEERLNFLALPSGTRYAKRILDHVMILNRQAAPSREMEIEKDRNNYMKECAFELHDVHDLCEELLGMRSPDWEIPLRFDKLFIEKERGKKVVELYQGLTGYGAILQLMEVASNILDDFRLSAFKRKDSRAF